ncbi:CLUMA_CG014931, isoform A [Clunio marinus]|uniref:Battenin n=1 Tax=Clunio marinus TaxID=568069 RepID=A0A1J1INB5_9DIPT|nr:CLUMA_CG014931, isoform A [Clunio marinus]
MTKKSFNLFNSKQVIAVEKNDKEITTENDDAIKDVEESVEKVKDPGLWRDLVAYWMFGLCNNFGYVVMLTAAHDIINELSGDHNEGHGNEPLAPGVRPCNVLSTGAILLADIIPGLIIKTLSPFLPFWATVRVTVACIVAICGFVAVAFADSQWLALGGVAMTSFSSGLGEPTFLAYSAFFNKNVISTWSSGTGGAGIVGALAYSILRGVGLSNQQTLLVMISVPAVELVVFYFLLRKPASKRIEDQHMGDDVAKEDIVPKMKTVTEKLIYIKSLVPYMLPIALVYFFEYFINQGLFELVYFPDIFLDSSEQYRWYQVTYQIGVFVSRSSVNIIQIKQIWVMAILQGLNVVFFSFEAVYMFTPSIWIIFGMIFFEGLLGGGAYVNTFYRMSKEIPATRREFAMSVVTLSDSIGITAAGFAAIPTHNLFYQGLTGGLSINPTSVKNVYRQ